jgi:hypothetical protein
LLHLAGGDLHFLGRRSKALGRDADRVLARRKVLYVVSARAVCGGGDDEAAGILDRDGGSGNYCSRLIDDLSAKMAGWGLGKQRTGTRNKNEDYKSGDLRAVRQRTEFHQSLLNKSFTAGGRAGKVTVDRHRHRARRGSIRKIAQPRSCRWAMR